jgi:hypothetical protein
VQDPAAAADERVSAKQREQKIDHDTGKALLSISGAPTLSGPKPNRV